IVWDDRLKQWIDVNDPDGVNDLNKIPPPPLAPSSSTSTSSPSSFVMPRTDENLMNAPPNYHQQSAPIMSGPIASRSSMRRSRYVNIMANETIQSSSPLEPPPFPKTPTNS
ncbi:unnamed protein product, partial [Schistosoma turkestanicum]